MKLATKTKKLFILLAPLVVYAVIAAVMVGMHFANSRPATAAAEPEASTPQGDYEFVFTGTVETATGRTFTLDMIGNKDEGQTLNLTVKEMPALNLTGTWTFTEGKGYKVFLDDANGTFAYSRYNPDTETFSLTFDYDMGNFGQPRGSAYLPRRGLCRRVRRRGPGPEAACLFPHRLHHLSALRLWHSALCRGRHRLGQPDQHRRRLVLQPVRQLDVRRGGRRVRHRIHRLHHLLTDGNFDIHEDPAGDYILWTKFPIGAEEPEYGTHLLVSELQDTYQLFTDPYEYHAQYDEATGSYQIAIEAQYNWGLGHGDIVTFSGSASVADMEG